MGVDWDTCAECGKPFPDCDDFTNCGEGCQRFYCGDCNVEIIRYGLDPNTTFCPYCNPYVLPGSVSDENVLHFLLAKAGMTVDQVMAEIKASFVPLVLSCGLCKKPQHECNRFMQNERHDPAWEDTCFGYCCACTEDMGLDKDDWCNLCNKKQKLP